MRRRLAILGSLAVLATLFAWLRFGSEPTHKGARLGTILDGGASGGLAEAQEAARVLGAGAVPYLMKVLEREPTVVQRGYARYWPRLPAKIQKLAPAPQKINQRRAWAAAALTQAGAHAVRAVPLLMKIASGDPFFGTRHNAVGSLAAIAPGSRYEGEAASIVIGRISDENQQLREHAYSSLGAFTNELRKVVPILLHGLRDPVFKESALLSLKRIGPNAMPVVRERVQNEGYLPMSFDALERELATRPPD